MSQNATIISVAPIVVLLVVLPVHGQDYARPPYYPNQPQNWGNPSAYGNAPAPRSRRPRTPAPVPGAGLQYDHRDAEMILREQAARGGNGRGRPEVPNHYYRGRPNEYGQESPGAPPGYGYPYGSEQQNYGHRINDESQVRRVMAEARYIGGFIRQKNGKPFVIIDKRNYQFYLYDANGRLLRIGPVAIGKGKTEVGAFETPVGVFPIRSKVPVDDWIRPDWYFLEEGEPIPKKWEDRRVPGFFRYKLVFDGARYIHYAEATGGRLTHGCLGLDWEDAEAVFHTMEVGSYCIIMDPPFLEKLARGEFPVKTAAKPKKPEEQTAAGSASDTPAEAARDEKVFRNMW